MKGKLDAKTFHLIPKPLLTNPPALDALSIGNYGFDPMGISTTITDLNGDLKYVREAEIIHGRLAMLACLGWIAPEFVRIPGPVYGAISSDPVLAQFQVPGEAWLQIFIFIAFSESFRSQIVFSDNFSPGEHGFDPLNFAGKATPEKLEELKLKELKNGRVAMIGILGMFCQSMVTGTGIFGGK